MKNMVPYITAYDYALNQCRPGWARMSFQAKGGWNQFNTGTGQTLGILLHTVTLAPLNGDTWRDLWGCLAKNWVLLYCPIFRQG